MSKVDEKVEETFEELNEVRRDPEGYLDKVKVFKGYFDEDNVLRIPGVLHGIKTEEGPAAYDEAAEYLKKATPVCELTPSKGLFAIASDILKIVQNEDPDNLDDIDMDAIVEKYGNYERDFHRSIQYGGTSGEHTIMDLFVGDGDKSRSQREGLLNDNLRKVGIACGTHDRYRFVNIIVACTKFNNKSGNDNYTI